MELYSQQEYNIPHNKVKCNLIGDIPERERICFIGGCDEKSPVFKNRPSAAQLADTHRCLADGMDAGSVTGCLKWKREKPSLH